MKNKRVRCTGRRMPMLRVCVCDVIPKDMDDIKMKYGSLEEQENDGNSIYNFVKQTIALRNEYPVIARERSHFDEGFRMIRCCVIRKTCDEGQSTLVFNTSGEGTDERFGKSASEQRKTGNIHCRSQEFFVIGERKPLF